MVAAKPIRPDQLLVRWTEFLAEFQELPNLVPAGTQLSFIQYFCLDVIAVLLFVILVVLYFVYKILMFAIFMLKKCCCGGKKKQKKA